jgi:hypothetical protein
MMGNKESVTWWVVKGSIKKSDTLKLKRYLVYCTINYKKCGILRALHKSGILWAIKCGI